MSNEVRLIGESRFNRHFRGSQAGGQEISRIRQSSRYLKSVRRHAERSSEASQKMI